MSIQSQYLTIHNDWEVARGLVLAQMNELSNDRKPYDVELLTTFPSLQSVRDFIFIGSFSWVCKAKNWKWLIERHAWQTASGWQTPAEIARD
jgi:hypothetical protein